MNNYPSNINLNNDENIMNCQCSSNNLNNTQTQYEPFDNICAESLFPDLDVIQNTMDGMIYLKNNTFVFIIKNYKLWLNTYRLDT